MNYRHSFHAGNFADVIKHVVLMRVLDHLKLKDAPFRIIDTHAGAGMYDLRSEEASRTGEWVDGVARLDKKRLGAGAEAVLSSWRAALRGLTPLGDVYPGSPALIRHALRTDDRASFNELHPETCHALRRALGRDDRLVINEIDGYLAWKAQVPPRERRGLVLVDPPFEKDDEFDRMAETMREMGRKWPTGTAILWYPIKNLRAVSRFETDLQASGFAKLLIVELHVDRATATGPLAACGLAIANPPWTLADEMVALLPTLSKLFARKNAPSWRVDWLAGP
jgi:23S rRNA (adenine2030-N6)-methyltransferase